MRLRIFTEPQQGATYDAQLAAARCAEEEGFDAYFRSDHYLSMGGVDGLPGPTDSWITLAGLARETTSIRLGTLLTAGTFRFPGPLAISVAQVDQMSGGRVELGLGAGWYAEEHDAYAIPFPSLKDRFERLEDQLAIVSGLWATPTGETFDFAGTHLSVKSSPALPKPAQQPGPPIIVGGAGLKRTPALAARFAAEINTPMVPLDTAKAVFAAADQACDAIGRDPGTLRHSSAVVTCCGADEAEVARRAKRMGRDAAELRATEGCVAGTPDEVIDQLKAVEATGAVVAYLQCIDLEDLDHVRLLGREVMPHLA